MPGSAMNGILIAILTVSTVARPQHHPPRLPSGERVATSTSPDLLKPTPALLEGVEIAKQAPTIDFLYYPEQTYPGKPWSVWGDGLAAGGKYYSAIGDHKAPDGNAFVYEYDPTKKTIRTLVDLAKVLNIPDGHYRPGKIHSRIDMGSDGWLYFATHRGSTRITTDRYHYKGDWIVRHHPGTGKTEIVAHAPAGRQCIPTSVLDPDRLIFYGGTAAADHTDKRITFFAWDVRKKKLLHSCEGGPYRYLIFARSTGRVYFLREDGGALMRYDPESGKPPVKIEGSLGLRSATMETPGGIVYTVSTRRNGSLWSFNTKTEEILKLGPAAVASQDYVTTLDADPTGRFLYYVPGAHGGSQNDGSPIVQYDTRRKKRKVIAFLHPHLKDRYGYVPLGTFGSALSAQGDKLYVTWNGNRLGPDKRRGRYPFDTCAMTVIHIPEAERKTE